MKTLEINFFSWNSLRVHDQPILLEQKSSNYLINLAVLEPNKIKTWNHNLVRFSKLQRVFHLDCLRNLNNQLELMGPDQRLIVLKSPKQLVELVTQLKKIFKIEIVKMTRQYTFEELEMIRLWESLVDRVHLVDSLTFVSPNDYDRMPSTFTHFRKLVESNQGPFRECVASHKTKLKPYPKNEMLHVQFEKIELRDDNDWNPDERTSFPFRGGEQSAQKRVFDYFYNSGNVKRYKKTRNGLFGTEFSTKFSPFLAFGCVSASWIYNELKQFEIKIEQNESTYWVFFELLWRDFFIFIARDFGSLLFNQQGIAQKNLEWRYDDQMFKRWCEGQTGVPFVDAAMRELKETGYMSNRARQNVASYLINDLKLDWTLGAEWFESKLLDFDCSSNYGNWQYLAGVGNDPLQSRYFNVIKQAIDYDPEGLFVKRWCPELNECNRIDLFAPWLNPNSKYPKPLVIGSSWKKQLARLK